MNGQTAIQKKDLNFGQALDALKSGKKVSRKTAQDDAAYWNPSTSDLLAEDWEILD